MGAIEDIVWNGTLNVQFQLPPELTVKDARDPTCYIKLNRESYLPCLMRAVMVKLQQFMNCLPESVLNRVWVEYDSVPLTWTLPVGVLYDICKSKVVCDRPRIDEKPNMDYIEVWCLQICYLGSDGNFPKNVIPIVGDNDGYIRSLWMHSWKQSCYVLNGNAKRMMSLARHESQLFWESVHTRELNQFQSIKRKIIPSNLQKIPIKLHKIDNGEELMPLINVSEVDYTVKQLVQEQLSQYVKENGELSVVLIAQGIVLTPNDNLRQLFNSLISIDGWLHIVII